MFMFRKLDYDERSLKAIKNVMASILFKGGSILISLILVPLTLSYLNSYEYGVWLTLSSVLTWVYVLDIGLGNGLRNKLVEALALNDRKLARVYVSTTFFSLLLIVVGLYLFFLILQPWLDWATILNVDAGKIQNINYIVKIVFAFFCASFILKTIGNIYMAYQRPAINDLLSLLGSALSLLLIYLCTLFSSGSLERVAVIYSASPMVVFLIAYPITFTKYKDIKPSFSFVKFGYFRHLLSLGIQFFVIQISYLILFMTSNFVISHLFGPEEVTPYNIAFKYFSLVTMSFSIILSPIWSAITDAYVINDMVWVQRTMKKLLRLWVLFALLTVAMVVISPIIYTIWVGGEIKIPFTLSVVCGIYACISNWNNIFAFAINGIGKIRLQLYSSIASGILFLPLAFYYGNLLGLSGLMVAMCICLLISSICFPIQYWKIMNNRATGIWNK